MAAADPELAVAIESARILAAAGLKPTAAEWLAAQRCLATLAEASEMLMAVPPRARASTADHVAAWRVLREAGWSWARIARVSGGFSARGVALRVGAARPLAEALGARARRRATLAALLIRRGVPLEAASSLLGATPAEVIRLSERASHRHGA